MVKLSIVIPNYNNEKYIEQCINSILNQTYTDYEIIVIDDGSKDKSVEIIKFMTKDKKNVKLIEQYNQNASIARNKGIEIASGEYILFIDSDDFISDRNVLGNMVEKIKDNDLLLCNYKRVDDKNNFINDYNVKDDIEIDGQNIIEKYAFVSAVPTNKLFRTKILHENNIYFDNVDIGQDLNFYLKYLALCNSIVTTDDYSYCYRVNDNGMTRKINYNFLDITKSVDCIRKFYARNNIKSQYVIDAIGFKNYVAQMNKLEKYEKKSDKKFIYNYFNYFINKLEIDKNYMNRNKKLKELIRVYKYKKMFKFVYLSNYYTKIKNLFLK